MSPTMPWTCGKLQRGTNCLPYVSSCATDFFRDVFVERKTLAVRCVAQSFTYNDGNHA